MLTSNNIDDIQLPPDVEKACNKGLLYYTLYGILFGCLFPLSAWLFEILYNDLPVTFSSIHTIHKNMLLLYMIDTAPFFLGIFASIAGLYKVSTDKYSQKLQMLVVGLEKLVRQRTKELEQANENLQKSYLQASASARAQGAFLANMSHEIRTPMNAIIGMATIAKKYLENQNHDTKIENSINQILVSSRHLLGLINNILDLSKIEAGEFTLHPEAFLLPNMLAECSQIVMPRCMEKDITLEIKQEGIENLAISSDKLRIMQVLINLIGNAVKFTENNGTIVLEVKLQTLKENNATLDFAVHDTGIGMNPETLDILFQPFKQGTGTAVRRAGGTGLGLAISQNIVSTLGGKIRAASTLDKGSSFFFTLTVPIAQPEQQKLPVTQNPLALRGKRILLVEDVEINRIIAAELLEDTGVTLEMANDGNIGVDMFAKSAPGYYNLILMDVQMPTMDGYEATRNIRALERPDAQSIPIIAMTANAMKEDAIKSKESGMNDHISKPIDVAALISMLEDYLSQA